MDDLAEMWLHRLQKLHQQANDAMADYRLQHLEQADVPIALLGQIVSDWQASPTPAQRLQAVHALIGTAADTIRAQCDTHLGYAGNNDLPFLVPLFTPHRKLLLDILTFLRPTSTSAATALEQAIAVVLRHRPGRAARLSMMGDDHGPDRALDLSWIPPRWWKAVTGRHRRDVPVVTVDRKYLELCVLSCAMMELKSGDLCVAGSEHFGDYRHQWVSWDAYEQNLLSEYHLRYGGWGGIGYDHVSETYMALFSSFMACGVWEAVSILDGLLHNRAEIPPDTLHADTQGQSETVFGLASL